MKKTRVEKIVEAIALAGLCVIGLCTALVFLLAGFGAIRWLVAYWYLLPAFLVPFAVFCWYHRRQSIRARSAGEASLQARADELAKLN